MMYNYGTQMMGNWFLGGFLMYLLLIAFLILGIAFFIKELTKGKE